MSETKTAVACNWLAIRQAARHVTQLYDGHLAPAGLRTTQFSLLARLDRVGPLPINELASGLVMDRTTMGRALRPLEREGLLEIGPGPDGRTRAVGLTAAGKRRLKEAMPLWRDAQRAFEAGYGAKQAAELRSALHGVLAGPRPSSR